MKNPKHIVITGASSGIGEALALQYAKTGITLSLSGRDEERLSKVAQDCRAKGVFVQIAVLDVTEKEAMAEWLKDIYHASPIDLVIANAGISGGTGGILQGEATSQARKIFDVNITGVLNTIEPVIDLMQSNAHQGQIALISSLAGFRGWPSAPAYSASKGWVRIYGEGLRGSLRKTGIAVNVICPGFVTSRMTDANNFPMPMKMEAQKAAQIIAQGLAKNKGRICFPLLPHFVAWFVGILPDALAQILLKNAPAKPLLKE